MAHHDVDKDKIKNDIILTAAMAVSMLGVRQIMFLTNLMEHEWDVAIFLVLSFFTIKITYCLFTKVSEEIESSDWYKQRQERKSKKKENKAQDTV